MADLLIKGMEMPKNYPYRLTLYPNGHVKEHTGYSGHGHYQAIELPPHGRCIDADELEASDAIDIGKEAWDMVHNAPTVLEATYE